MNYSMFIKELGGCKRDIAKAERKSGKQMWVVVSNYLNSVAVRDYNKACRICNARLAFDGSSQVKQIN